MGGCLRRERTETESGRERDRDTQRRRRKDLLPFLRILPSLPPPTFARECEYAEKLVLLARVVCVRVCMYVCGFVCVRACVYVCVWFRMCVCLRECLCERPLLWACVRVFNN